MPTLEDQRISPSEAARLLHLSGQRVRELCDEGVLPCDRTPLGRLIPLAAVERLALERAARLAPIEMG